MIEASDNLFAACAAPMLTMHALPDGGLRTLTQACRTVERIAADEGVADVVRPLLTKVKAMRFCLTASPVHGGDPDLRLSSVALRLASAEEQLAWSASPRLAAEFKKIRPLVVELSRRQTLAAPGDVSGNYGRSGQNEPVVWPWWCPISASRPARMLG